MTQEYRTSKSLIGVDETKQSAASKESLRKQIESIDDKITEEEKRLIELKNRREKILNLQRGNDND